MRDLLQAHTKTILGVAALIAGITLLSFDDLIPGNQMLPGIALAVIGNQFVMCDRITAAIGRIESPTRAEKQHWLDTGKGIGFREARRAPRPLTLLRSNGDAAAECESFLSS